MYYVEKENKIVLFDEKREKVANTLQMMPQYKGCEIKKTDRPIADFEWADTPQYQAKKEAEAKAARVQELQEQLDELDLKCIRGLRALSSGVGTEEDKNKLEELEIQAAGLRAEIRELEGDNE